MAQVLVRNLGDATVERLKRRARSHGRSLQAELHDILERAARTDIADARRAAEKSRRKLSDREHSDSAQLVGEDRSR
jgi:plasmid stability protein